jgi:hypothetical protein
MRKRINRREQNLAKVSADKAEADALQTSGIFYMFSYFDKETRREHKVDIDENNRWIYEGNHKPVPNGEYMYAVGQNGAIYIGHPTVHSQFKAGKDTQSAGWLTYRWDEQKSQATVMIDNCSGHYTPTLSQFLSTLHGLHTAKVMPDHFQLKLSKFTKIDYAEKNNAFWQDVINDSKEQLSSGLSKQDETALLTVEYSAKIDGFIFSRGTSESLQMTKQEILKNSEKSSANRSFLS